MLTYARDAQTGRLDYSRIATEIHYRRSHFDVYAALKTIANAASIFDELVSFEPPHPQYKRLKAKLAGLLASPPRTSFDRIEPSPVSAIGIKDERIPKLRARLGIPPLDEHVLDQPLIDAIRQFQRVRRLPDTGLLDDATFEALNGPSEIDIIRANMERWRWMPRSLGTNHVIVNVPAYTMHVFSSGSPRMITRVVVGSPSHPTPLMSDAIESITINPIWNVPVSIVHNEYLPKLRGDPTFAERSGIKVVSYPDGRVHMYQPPGEANALGALRINFPNRFLVYQHDTPDQHLFAEPKRAYSHGCIRVQNPFRYSEILLSMARPGEGYTMERLHRMSGPDEVHIDFPQPVPIHLTYQTAAVDETGKLQIWDDIYGYDRRVIEAFKRDKHQPTERELAQPKVSRHGVAQQSLLRRGLGKVERASTKLLAMMR